MDAVLLASAVPASCDAVVTSPLAAASDWPLTSDTAPPDEVAPMPPRKTILPPTPLVEAPPTNDTSPPAAFAAVVAH